jgi:hypothetical protein
MLCRIGWHQWVVTHKDGPAEQRGCSRCGRIESTTYDMAYGGTYWVPGESNLLSEHDRLTSRED